MTVTPSPQPAGSAWLCPGCDVEPAPPTGEPICPACGAKLVEVKPRGDDLTGQVIDGRFEIRGLVGEGGMGTVYRAWQRSIGRELAIKLIDARHSRDPMAVRRFLREARLASQLSQPNTVSVFDFGQAGDGRLFIAMELVRGRTLADVLDAEGRFPVARAAWIGVQLCDALDAAHRLHIVHRDLKPANVVVLDDPPGRDLVKVLDFGLAKSLKDTETHATDTGLVVGTPRYMAPEVVMGESPTPQSDLYAVGVILGELVTGKALWDATSFPALAGQKMVETPVLREMPEGIRAVVAKLVAPEVGDRPASASQARGMLRPLVADSETPVPMNRPRDERPRLTGPTVAARAHAPTVDDEAALSAAPPLPSVAIPLSASEAQAATPSSLASLSSVAAMPRRSRALVAGAGLVIAGAVVAAIAVATRDRPRPPPPPPPPQPAAVIDAAVAEPAIAADAAEAAPIDAAAIAMVNLTVTSRPSGLAVRIDGVERGTTPVTVPVPRGTSAVAIEATIKGKVVRRTAIPDRDQVIDLAATRGTRPGGLPF